MIGVTALVYFAGAGVPQDEAAHCDSKQEHDEKNIHVGVVITARLADWSFLDQFVCPRFQLAALFAMKSGIDSL